MAFGGVAWPCGAPGAPGSVELGWFSARAPHPHPQGNPSFWPKERCIHEFHRLSVSSEISHEAVNLGRLHGRVCGMWVRLPELQQGGDLTCPPLEGFHFKTSIPVSFTDLASLPRLVLKLWSWGMCLMFKIFRHKCSAAFSHKWVTSFCLCTHLHVFLCYSIWTVSVLCCIAAVLSLGVESSFFRQCTKDFDHVIIFLYTLLSPLFNLFLLAFKYVTVWFVCGTPMPLLNSHYFNNLLFTIYWSFSDYILTHCGYI